MTNQPNVMYYFINLLQFVGGGALGLTRTRYHQPAVTLSASDYRSMVTSCPSLVPDEETERGATYSHATPFAPSFTCQQPLKAKHVQAIQRDGRTKVEGMKTQGMVEQKQMLELVNESNAVCGDTDLQLMTSDAGSTATSSTNGGLHFLLVSITICTRLRKSQSLNQLAVYVQVFSPYNLKCVCSHSHDIVFCFALFQNGGMAQLRVWALG